MSVRGIDQHLIGGTSVASRSGSGQRSIRGTDWGSVPLFGQTARRYCTVCPDLGGILRASGHSCSDSHFASEPSRTFTNRMAPQFLQVDFMTSRRPSSRAGALSKLAGSMSAIAISQQLAHLLPLVETSDFEVGCSSSCSSKKQSPHLRAAHRSCNLSESEER
jgi:hypothetical protein